MAKEKKRKMSSAEHWWMKQREKFREEHGDKTDRELQEEILFELIRIRNSSNKTRENTSTLITWIIVIPILVGLALWLLGQSM